MNKRKIKYEEFLSYPGGVVIFGSVGAGLLAALIALPTYPIFGIPSLSNIILSYTSIWRIFAREYVVVNIAVVILAAIVLSYFSHALKSRKKLTAALFVLILVSIFIQYQAFAPLKGNTLVTFRYKSAPEAYYWIKGEDSIRNLAEYPIEPMSQTSSSGYYLTMQSIHKKPLLNSALSNGPGEKLHASIRNLVDPQTVPALHALGIDTVIVHGALPDEINKIPYLKVIYSQDNVDPYNLLQNSYNRLVIAKIVGAPKITKILEFAETLPPNPSIQNSPLRWEYELPNDSNIKVRSIPEDKNDTNADSFEACFSIKMAAKGDMGLLTIAADNITQRQIGLTDSYQEVKIPVKDSVKFTVSNGHNMRITDLGCR